MPSPVGGASCEAKECVYGGVFGGVYVIKMSDALEWGFGVTVNQVVVRPLAGNKGRGKPLKGAREIAADFKKRGERTCATCGEANGHDSRNCALRKKKSKENRCGYDSK
nr:protein FAR1-RELATED SEQUENCE 5-like [Ipomoea batatas]